MLELKETKQGVQLKIKVQPRASKNEICGVLDGSLKIRITSPPVDGEANAACIKLFATVLQTAKSNISIVSGETSRNKTLAISGQTAAQVRAKLEGVIKTAD